MALAKASTLCVQQALISAIAQASCGNVLLQQHVLSAYSLADPEGTRVDKVRLVCKCGELCHIAIPDMLDENLFGTKCVEWASGHKHLEAIKAGMEPAPALKSIPLAVQERVLRDIE